MRLDQTGSIVSDSLVCVGSIAYDLSACRAIASDQDSLDIFLWSDDRICVCWTFPWHHTGLFGLTNKWLIMSHMVSAMKHSPTPTRNDLIASLLVCAGKFETIKYMYPWKYVRISRQAMAQWYCWCVIAIERTSHIIMK